MAGEAEDDREEIMGQDLSILRGSGSILGTFERMKGWGSILRGLVLRISCLFGRKI